MTQCLCSRSLGLGVPTQAAAAAAAKGKNTQGHHRKPIRRPKGNHEGKPSGNHKDFIEKHIGKPAGAPQGNHKPTTNENHKGITRTPCSAESMAQVHSAEAELDVPADLQDLVRPQLLQALQEGGLKVADDFCSLRN